MITLLISLVSSKDEIDYNLTGFMDLMIEGVLVIYVLWSIAHGYTNPVNYL